MAAEPVPAQAGRQVVAVVSEAAGTGAADQAAVHAEAAVALFSGSALLRYSPQIQNQFDFSDRPFEAFCYFGGI